MREQAAIPSRYTAEEVAFQETASLFQELPRKTIAEAALSVESATENQSLTPLSNQKDWCSFVQDHPAVHEISALFSEIAGTHNWGTVPSRDAFVTIDTSYLGADGKKRRPLPKFVPRHIAGNLFDMQKAYAEFLETSHSTPLAPRPGLIVQSGYRSPYYQAGLFIGSLNFWGTEDTLRRFMLPGASQHADYEKCALDFISIGNSLGQMQDKQGRGIDFSMTLEGSWLLKNAAQFGFWAPYFPDPKNVSKPTGADGVLVEPWHFQYVGKDAQDLMRVNRVSQLFRERNEMLYTD